MAKTIPPKNLKFASQATARPTEQFGIGSLVDFNDPNYLNQLDEIKYSKGIEGAIAIDGTVGIVTAGNENFAKMRVDSAITDYIRPHIIDYWDSTVKYNLSSYVYDPTTEVIYRSLIQDNIGNLLTDVTKWTDTGQTLDSYIPAITELQVPATPTKRGITYLSTKIQLTYASSTTLTYKVLNKESDEEISNGTINLATVGANGLDTGSLQANTTYHIFKIKDLINNLVKTVTSTSLTSPILPTGFTIKKHIFSFITNASAQLRVMQIFNIGYNQYYISYTNPIVEFAPISVANAGTNLQLTIPNNIVTKVFLAVRAFGLTTSNISIGVAPPHVVNDTVTNSAFNAWFGGNTGTHDGGNEVHSFTDTNRTVRFFGRSDTTPTSLSISIFTKGYYLYL